jgi:hypothetical protein
MSDKISGKFHPIPSTMANQRWISIHNIIIYLETKFRPNRRIFVFGGHIIPWLPWQWPPFWICATPKAAIYYGGNSYKVDHNMVPKPWISIPNIKIYLETKFCPNRSPFWILFNPPPQKLPHTTVDISTNVHEVWWKEYIFFLNPPFSFPWQLRQNLSNRFRFFWLISFH